MNDIAEPVGLPSGSPNYGILNTIPEQDIIERIASGASLRAIAADIGCSEQALPMKLLETNFESKTCDFCCKVKTPKRNTHSISKNYEADGKFHSIVTVFLHVCNKCKAQRSNMSLFR